MKVIGKYNNGNTSITLFNDGTKIRETDDDEFISVFPESIDLKITDKCDQGCLMCHEKSTPEGKSSDILNEPFIHSLKPYTEVALGGGNVLEYENLIPLLSLLKSRKIFASATFHQTHFIKNNSLISSLSSENLLNGIGVSMEYPTDKLIYTARRFDNVVIHVIAGIVTEDQLDKLADMGLKILILGFKDWGRGKTYKIARSKSVQDNIDMLKESIVQRLSQFKAVAFDNLALNQLEMREQIPEKDWDMLYMGSEGSHTMYIDAVNREFAVNSTSNKRFPISDDIVNMFNQIKAA